MSVVAVIKRPIIVWRIVDGKAGHESQTAGLVRALEKSIPLECHDIPALGRWEALRNWVSGKFESGRSLPAPHLIVGAGHATHFSVLSARKAFGGRTVVLMKPFLPLSWFDLCLIPEHDRPKDRSNVEATRGVLNAVLPAENPSEERGLLLIGGPSAHYDWDEATVADQVSSIVRRNRRVEWELTTSRRTPSATEKALVALDEPNLQVTPFHRTPSGWVIERLGSHGLVWVSEDSVSMIFEALTAGAKVGVLSVPSKRRRSRVRALVSGLIESGYVIRWESNTDLSRPAGCDRPKFSEAERCANRVIRLLNEK